MSSCYHLKYSICLLTVDLLIPWLLLNATLGPSWPISASVVTLPLTDHLWYMVCLHDSKAHAFSTLPQILQAVLHNPMENKASADGIYLKFLKLSQKSSKPFPKKFTRERRVSLPSSCCDYFVTYRELTSRWGQEI